MRSSLTLRSAAVPHLLRLLPRLPMLLGGSLALVLCALPLILSTHPAPGDAALLLRVAAVMCTVPTAFALDDPAARTTATLPFPLVIRRLLRLTLTLAPLAVLWLACGFLLLAALQPGDRIALPLAGLALEAAALGTATIMLAALGLRLSAGERGSTLAAPGSVLLPLVLVLTPARAELFVVPLAEGWASSRWVWGLALTVTAGATAALLREHRPVRRRLPHSTSPSPESTPSAPSGEPREPIHP